MDLAVLKRSVAQACRVLAYQGLAADVLGHVSVRVSPTSMLVRCRGPRESGLLFTTADDVHLAGLDGQSDLPDGYTVPAELPVHAETLRSRPDVMAVVHAHPPACWPRWARRRPVCCAATRNVQHVWRYHLARLQHAGLGL